MDSLMNFVLWTPDPELFSIGGFSIRYYSLMWAIGLAFAYT